ncbi:hypothetical protein M758_12G105700 [Ceratodon purpureus]|nr:hypothetical protein M758_12G105700 [Ceratodon purpureus]
MLCRLSIGPETDPGGFRRGEGVGGGAACMLSTWSTKWVDRLTVLVGEVEGNFAHCSCVCRTFFLSISFLFHLIRSKAV